MSWLLFTSCHDIYLEVRPAILFVLRNNSHVCLIDGHSRKICCNVSMSCPMQNSHSFQRPIRSHHAPTGNPSVRMSHCMAESFLGRYGCQMLLKNFARVLASMLAYSSLASCGIWWLS